MTTKSAKCMTMQARAPFRYNLYGGVLSYVTKDELAHRADPVFLEVRRAARRGDIMASPEASQLGTRLDAHHFPETNGRIAVCRRCGARTDSPMGHHHLPSEHQLARSVQWIDAQSQLSRIDRARAKRSAP